MTPFKFPPFRLFICTLAIAALGTFPSGYNVAVLNIPQSMIERFTNQSFYDHYHYALNNNELSILWSIIVNLRAIGGIAGAWCTMFFAEKYGRKHSLLVINNVIVIAASALIGLCKLGQSLEMFMIGRLVLGFACGLVNGLLAVYLTECSPVRHRGWAPTFINMFITTGTLVSEIVSLPELLGTEQLWPLLLALPAAPALILLVASVLLPESPSYLYLTKGNEEKARRSLRFFHGDHADVDAALAVIRKEKELAKEQLTLREALSNRDLFWPILISSVVNIARMTSGIMAIFTYSTSIYESVGLPRSQAPLASVITSTFNLAGSFISIPVIQRFGRRPLLLIGLITCTICNIVFMVFSLWQQYSCQQWPVYVSLVAVIVHVTVFNIGPGPVGCVIAAESTPQSVRSIGASVSVTVTSVAALITVLVYFPLQTAVGPWSFLLFIIPTSIAVVFLWFKMAETKDKTVDEIMKKWRRKDGKVAPVDANENKAADWAVQKL